MTQKTQIMWALGWRSYGKKNNPEPLDYGAFALFVSKKSAETFRDSLSGDGKQKIRRVKVALKPFPV